MGFNWNSRGKSPMEEYGDMHKDRGRDTKILQ